MREFTEEEILAKIREIRREEKKAYDRRRALRALEKEEAARKAAGKEEK